MARVIQVGASAVPPQSGVRVRCLGVEDVAASGDYGQGFRYEFELLSGTHQGAKSFRTIGADVRTANAGGKFLAGAFGKAELPLGKAIDIECLVGREFIADLAVASGGKNARVERLYPVPQQASAAPAPAEDLPASSDIPF